MKAKEQYSKEELQKLTAIERRQLLRSLEEAYLVVTEMDDKMTLLKSDIVKIIRRLK
jgi:hypothetical protein